MSTTDALMSTTDALLSVGGVLFAALAVGAIVWWLCLAVISGFLEKRPRLSSWLGRWRLMRWIAASSLSLFPDETARFFERVHDRDLPWRARLGARRVARETLYFTSLGCLILGVFYLWGTYKRSIQWYEVEPPPASEGFKSLNSPPRPDSRAWMAEWTLKGVFWSKATCLQGIRHDAEAALPSRASRHAGELERELDDEVQSFIAARRCIKANTPDAPEPEPGSDWDSDDPGGVP
ncbi:hypothetical protein [Candidatus Binatus sp.]|jgi:hypothetical protein|uniref:hypothetical protein n=1 Tax=Candidatus Binatus sp. TaxID=2811406 RepID=UPI003BE8526A